MVKTLPGHSPSPFCPLYTNVINQDSKAYPYYPCLHQAHAILLTIKPDSEDHGHITLVYHQVYTVHITINRNSKDHAMAIPYLSITKSFLSTLESAQAKQRLVILVYHQAHSIHFYHCHVTFVCDKALNCLINQNSKGHLSLLKPILSCLYST